MNLSAGCVSRGGHETYTSICRHCLCVSPMNHDETSVQLGEYIWTCAYHTTMCVCVCVRSLVQRTILHKIQKTARTSRINEYWLLNTKNKSTCNWVHRQAPELYAAYTYNVLLDVILFFGFFAFTFPKTKENNGPARAMCVITEWRARIAELAKINQFYCCRYLTKILSLVRKGNGSRENIPRGC